MINTLFLPELREMLTEQNGDELHEFCSALHPARTADFMEGLSAAESFQVLQFASPGTRAEIFSYFDWDRQLAILSAENDKQVAELITQLPVDDIVDLLQEVSKERVDTLLALVPTPDRRDIRRLQSFPEGTAGAVMTTEAACLGEQLTVRQALESLSRQAERLETIYYIYVTDDTNHLRGVVSNRRLVSAIGKPETRLGELMETDLIVANVVEPQEMVAQKVADYDLLAIPVVDDHRHMLGIITHDDIIDVVKEEAVRDAQRIAGVEPLADSYSRTPLFTLSWKRGMWLTILFFAALLTTFILRFYDAQLEAFEWLVWFIPLIVSCGGNSGSQSATLIITALATDDIEISDWAQILRREILTGLMLGGFLGSIGYLYAIFLAPTPYAALVLPLTIVTVVVCGTVIGSLLPLMFSRMGLDPALMSSPFVAGIIDIVGILIYINVARVLLSVPAT